MSCPMSWAKINTKAETVRAKAHDSVSWALREAEYTTSENSAIPRPNGKPERTLR